MNTLLQKACSVCRETKPLDQFFRATRRKDGKSMHCKSCQYEKDKAPGARWSRSRSQSKNWGMAWEITRDQYFELVAKPCHYCGDSLADSTGHCLDRIDGTKGYYFDNVIQCCWTCNAVRRSTFTVEEMELIGPVITKIKAERRAKGLPLPQHPRKGGSSRIRKMVWKRERCLYDEVETR